MRNLQSVRTSWERTLLISDYDADGYYLNWRLRNEDGTSLPMFQGKQGVMLMCGSDDEEEPLDSDEDHAEWLAADGDLVHYENLQFLDWEDVKSDLENCGLIP